MSKKTILVVAYGTADKNIRQVTIDLLLEEIAQKHTECRVELAFTSPFMIKRAVAAGETVADVTTTLKSLAEQGVQEVMILPLLVACSGEYDKIVAAVNSCTALFSDIKMGMPLLATTADYIEVCNVLQGEYGVSDERCLVLMGHGAAHFANASYAALDYTFKQRGHKNTFVGALEAYPDIDVIIPQIASYNPKSVCLAPLLLSSSRHSSVDMAGDEESSWKSQIEKAGYPVEVIMKGLCEIKAIRDIYISHIVM